MISARGRNGTRVSSQPAQPRRCIENSSRTENSRNPLGGPCDGLSKVQRRVTREAHSVEPPLRRRPTPPTPSCREESESPVVSSQRKQCNASHQSSRPSIVAEKKAALEVVSVSSKRPPVLRKMGGGGAIPRPPRRPGMLALSGRPTEAVFAMCGIITRIALNLSLQGLCGFQRVSRSTLKACSANVLWEQLCKARWPKAAAALEHTSNWKGDFLSLLRKGQQSFATKQLPIVFKKARRRDGFPDLQKMLEALRLRYVLRLRFNRSRALASGDRDLSLSGDSVNTFQTSTCLRCTFSSLKLRAPVTLEIVGHSAALGKDVTLISADLPSLSAWSEDSSKDENFRFIHSPCGTVLASVWRSDSAIAGLFFSIHHAHSLQLFCHGTPCESLLVQRPEYDDIDSRLGLHDYSLMLTLRSAKLETFSYCFYKAAARKNNGLVLAELDRKHLIRQTEVAYKSHAELAAAEGSMVSDSRREVAKATASNTTAKDHVSASRVSHRADFPWMQLERPLATEQYEANVAHFDVLSPHCSGEMPPFSCTGQLRIVFQTPAFKCVLPDATFLDVTAFDEHSHIFWAVSSVAHLTSSVPHSALKGEGSAIDFDRDDSSNPSNVRWLCLGDMGAASLVLQFSSSYDAGGTSVGTSDDCQEPPKMRLNRVSWHPELSYLNWWFGSNHST